MSWSKLCDCQRLPCYNGNESCSLCLSEKAKQERTTQRTQQKQAKDIAKQKERSKGTGTAINPVSQKQAQEAAELSRIKKDLIEKGGRCIACNTTYDLTLSHVISRRHKQYSTNPINLVLLCVSDHHIYEHDKVTFAMYYPNAWAIKLERAKQLSNTHYEQLRDKSQ